MKKKLRTMMVGMLAVLMLTGTASALTFNFYDNTINWSGWTPKYKTDQIGQPDVFQPPLVGMSVIVADPVGTSFSGYELLSVVMHMSGRQGIVDEWIGGSNGSISWDALFINTGNGRPYQSWDYYVEDTTGDNYTATGAIDGATLYSVSPDGYTYKFATKPSGSPLMNGRWGHPAGILTGINAIDGLSGVVWNENAKTLTYTFDDAGIILGRGFQIGYAEWCANDVILTPEPGVLLLLGFGLVGIAALRRQLNK